MLLLHLIYVTFVWSCGLSCKFQISSIKYCKRNREEEKNEVKKREVDQHLTDKPGVHL